MKQEETVQAIGKIEMGRFKVVEKFVSINGEARCAGELACL